MEFEILLFNSQARLALQILVTESQDRCAAPVPGLLLKTLTKIFKSSDMPDLHYNTSNPNTFLLQRMNNEHQDMYHNLVCEHRKLSNEHSWLRLELSKKGKLSRHISICQITFILTLHNIFLADTSYRADNYLSANTF
jgi:hypothetical protein